MNPRPLLPRKFWFRVPTLRLSPFDIQSWRLAVIQLWKTLKTNPKYYNRKNSLTAWWKFVGLSYYFRSIIIWLKCILNLLKQSVQTCLYTFLHATCKFSNFAKPISRTRTEVLIERRRFNMPNLYFLIKVTVLIK